MSRVKPTPSCIRCGHEIEDEVHFFVHCPAHRAARDVLWRDLMRVDSRDIAAYSPEELAAVLVSGSERLPLVQNMQIIASAINFIKSSERF